MNESNCCEPNILEDFVVCGMLAMGDIQVEVLSQRYFLLNGSNKPCLLVFGYKIKESTEP